MSSPYPNTLVSVIIPCYNAARYIQNSIESVLNQNYKPIEIILVDDGSTDESVAIASQYKEVKLFKQINSGACVARNLGLKHAQGKYIKFLDADDVLASDCIASQVAIAESIGDGYIVYGNFSILRDGRASLVRTDIGFESQTAKLLISDLLTSTPLHHTYMLKSVGGFDERFKSGQEWNLHVRLAAKGYAFYHIDQNIYFYRIHQAEGRISNQRKKYTTTTFAHEIDKISMTLEAIKLLSHEDLSDYISMKYWWLGRLALRQGLIDSAEKCFELAKSISIDYKKNWPFYYRFLYELFGVYITENMFKPVYRIFGGKYTKF